MIKAISGVSRNAKCKGFWQKPFENMSLSDFTKFMRTAQKESRIVASNLKRAGVNGKVSEKFLVAKVGDIFTHEGKLKDAAYVEFLKQSRQLGYKPKPTIADMYYILLDA